MINYEAHCTKCGKIDYIKYNFYEEYGVFRGQELFLYKEDLLHKNIETKKLCSGPYIFCLGD